MLAPHSCNNAQHSRCRSTGYATSEIDLSILRFSARIQRYRSPFKPSSNFEHLNIARPLAIRWDALDGHLSASDNTALLLPACYLTHSWAEKTKPSRYALRHSRRYVDYSFFDSNGQPPARHRLRQLSYARLETLQLAVLAKC